MRYGFGSCCNARDPAQTLVLQVGNCCDRGRRKCQYYSLHWELIRNSKSCGYVIVICVAHRNLPPNQSWRPTRIPHSARRSYTRFYGRSIDLSTNHRPVVHSDWFSTPPANSGRECVMLRAIGLTCAVAAMCSISVPPDLARVDVG